MEMELESGKYVSCGTSGITFVKFRFLLMILALGRSRGLRAEEKSLLALKVIKTRERHTEG